MRIVSDVMNDMVAAIERTAADQDRAARQLSSGRRVQHAADDPVAFSSATHTASRIADNDQFTTSTSTVQAMMETADSTLSSVVTALTRAISLGVEGANGSVSGEQRQSIAGEVSGIRDTVFSLANTALNNTYLFAGTKSTIAPFTLDSTDPSGVKYVGSTDANRVQIGESLHVQVGQTGVDVFTDPDANVFRSLNDLYRGFVNNDTGAISDATSALRAALDHVTGKRVFYGNSMQLLEQNTTFLNNNKVELSKQWDGLVAIDPTDAASQLVNAQQAHDRTLAAASQVSQLSLLDYLQ